MKRSKTIKALAGAVLGFVTLLGADAWANQHSGVTSPGQGDMMMEPGSMACAM